ncbi:hypothetical protein DFQ28_000642 [Apophysomyces sp. BC1034]|nr:hypothetical protein DFQ30_009085 [Apophysomyces sp. BC1015]KAG0173088.1 hypothetical protein DFQ29_008103 [Apophysomyces sp. BC1021]KAG0183890.1 hypothetical protein DFQ28_000642 [Apophysomyces sp. BC1034]
MGMIYRWQAVSQFKVSLRQEQLQAIDKKYCGGPCRFLLPVHIGEQESKAQMHLRQLAFMSGLVNRTLVLPNVGMSRIGACLEHDFEFYYSADWVNNHTDAFSAISLEDFKSWLKERQVFSFKPKAQAVHLLPKKKKSGHAALATPPFCMEDLLEESSERWLYLEEKEHPRAVGIIQDTIKDLLIESDQEEVLNIYYDKRYPFIHNKALQKPIPYNHRLINLADQFSSQLTPYWAVHWRTETLRYPENLVPCAQSLVDLIHNKSQSANPTLFLLTDYPHTFTEEAIDRAINIDNDQTVTDDDNDWVPVSTSFSRHGLTPFHHTAMQYLYKHLHVHLSSLESSTVTPANWTVLSLPQSIAQSDPGILGIVDKLIAIRADVFVAGQPNICARRSSYTSRIVDERVHRRISELKENGITVEDDKIGQFHNHEHDGDFLADAKMKNIIEYFNLPR